MATMHLMIYCLGNFFSIFMEVPASYCDLGATFLILLLNTCLGLDSISGHSHLLEFLTCVGPWIISVQFRGFPLPFSVGEVG